MLNFTQFNEKLITFHNKAYPKYNQIVMLVGGSGSGKGFVLDKLIGIEGKVFDVDRTKQLLAKSSLIDFNVDFRNPEDVQRLHKFQLDNAIDLNIRKMLGRTNIDSNNKPNLVFDMTGRNIRQFEVIQRFADRYGYDRENMHVVWVVNDLEVARQQNKMRSRVVPDDILTMSHLGASETMLTFLANNGKVLRNLMDGDVWIVFNQKDEDTIMKGKIIDTANYHKVKSSGQKMKDLPKWMRWKIQNYSKVDWS